MWNTKIIDFIRSELHGNHAIFKETPFYRGDSSLRKANLTFDLTEDERDKMELIGNIHEFVKYLCPPVFPERYGTITLRDYQVAFLNTVSARRFISVLKSRQMGFSMLSAILALHLAACETDKTFMLITDKGAAAEEFMDKVKMFYMSLPFFMKPGIVAWNARSIEFDNGCKIIAKGATQDTMPSRSVHFLYIDDAAFIKDIQKIFRTVIQAVVNSEDSRVVVASSPNGYNWFYDNHTKAEDGVNEFTPLRYHWSQVPGRDDHWKNLEIRNIGQDRFDIEYDLQWTAKNVVGIKITNDDVDQMLDAPSKDWLRSEIQKLKDGIKKLETIANGR